MYCVWQTAETDDAKDNPGLEYRPIGANEQEAQRMCMGIAELGVKWQDCYYSPLWVIDIISEIIGDTFESIGVGIADTFMRGVSIINIAEIFFHSCKNVFTFLNVSIFLSTFLVIENVGK